MNVRDNTTLSHLYGLSGLIPGAVGIVAAVQSNSPWSTYALVISGWIAAILYGVMLVRCFNQARNDGETIGRLRGEISALEARVADADALLQTRSSTLDFVAGLKMGKTGTARTSAAPAAHPAPQQPTANAASQGDAK